MAARIREPVDPSHIPSKLQKAEPANGVARRTTQSKRQIRANSQFQSTYDHQLEYPPAAPEVPRGPPISYRQQYGGDTIDQPRARSFSQRAKGQMLAPEALEDNEYWDDNDDIPAPVRISEDLRRSTDRTHARASVQNGLNIPKREARKDPSHRQTDMPPLGNPESTPKVHRRSGRGLKHSAEVEPLKLDLSSPPLSSSGSVSRRVSEGQGRDWADNRSPLQTLEVKLNDISKEEKRARVEEAEMLLRESKAVHGARQASREGTATSKRNGYTREGSLDAGNIESRELDCKTNGVRLDKTQHKSDVEPQKPVQRLPSGQSERADVHQEQSFAARSGAEQKKLSRDQVRSQQQASRTSDHTPSTGGEYRPLNLEKHQRESHASADITPIEPSSGHHLFEATEFDQGRPALRTEQRGKPQNEMKRAISTRQASAPQSIPSNITRAVSLQQHQPQPFFPEDQDISKSGPMRETNSSHKAALAEATATVSTSGATAATSIKHDNSRKLQKAPPGNLNRGSSSELETPKSIDDGVAQFGGSAVTPRFEIETVVQDPKVEFYYRGGMPKQVDVQRPNSQRVSEPAGPGLKEPAVAESPTATNRPRQTSVSFKVPFDKARPVNEWKQAGVARLTLADLALDLPSEHDKPWWESNGTSGRSRSKRSSGNAQTFDAFSQLEDTKSVEFKPPLYLKCGPLLRYTGMRRDRVAPQPGQTDKPMEREVWRGSVMIVTHDSQSSYEEVPTLRLFSQPRDLLPPPPEQVQGDDLAPEYIDPIAGLTKVSRRGQTLYVKPVDRVEESIDLSRVETDDGLFETSPSPIENTSHGSATPNKRTRGRDGESLGKYKEVKGVRLYADIERDVTFWRFNIEVELGSQQAHIAYRINRGPPVGFWVPAKSQTMNIMFHSCNGFSLSVNPDKFSGPDPLWRDVLNTHQTRPFHVMIGGGDQIYNDRVMVDTTHFAAWTHLRIPHEKHHAPFTDDMREELESFYLNRYAMWFSQGLFGLANSQIPMVNIYDDHDIIDGFGSYPDHFQKAPVFMGIGNIAFKYYMLFQHQSVPEETQVDEPSWLLGAKPGPYIQQLSRSVFLNLGQSVAFLGLDCRTERQRHSILTDDTYDIILARCRKEIEEGEIRHLLVLLGVPIAYPRLVWLENILTSKAMTPVKALGRAGVFRGGFLNKFDGGVEVLDDLDDHWTATGHKEERYDLILDLQELAAEKSIRITILGGDVHLAGVGQFYSNPKLRIPKDRDHRYIPNVISSAIVNTPPPEMLADTLNKRNKIHHFDRYTIEDMIPMFTHDVDGKKRNNKRLLPRRNWCSIREYRPGSTPPPTPPESLTPTDKMSQAGDYSRRRFSFSREDANPRKLFRRLSNRGAPPSSYRDSMNITSPTNARPASHDGYFPNAEPQTAPATRTSFSMSNNPVIPQTAPASRTSFTSTASYNHRASIDALPSAPNPRPGIFRRPTNLSEKAARKGGSLTDSQGNLIDADLSDHINLEGGLDITLNCEVNQGDPAGITTPYRLLIPALRYDGSSDDQKLDSGDVSGVQRKPTLLKKLGFGRTGNRSTADRQGQGNWGQGSESESEVINQDQYSDEDDDQPNYYEKPEKRSSSLKRWFSGRKGNKQDHPYSPSNYEQPGSQMYSQQQQSPQSQKGAGAEDEFAGRELKATPPQTQQQQLAAPPTTIPTQTAPIPPSRSTTTAGSSSGDKLTTYHQPSSNLQPPPRRQPPDPDPEIESFPHHPRGKAAQMLGVGIDQGPGTHHHPPPLSAPLPQQLRPRSSSTHTPTTSSPLIQGWTPTTVGGGGGGGAGSTSLNASQPLPPPSSAGNGSGGFKAKPSLLASAAFGEDVGVAGGKGKGGWANYDLSRPLPMSAGGQGQQGQVVRGYEGLDAYPGRKVEKKQRRGSLSAAGGAAFKRWFS